MGQSEGSHLLEYSDENPIYEGWALRTGADTSTEVWRIKRYTWVDDNMTEEAWANGNKLYDNEWDNRATLTYVVAL